VSAATVVTGASALLAFLLEMAVYVALGHWAFTRSATAGRIRRWAAALAAVLAAALVWGQFGAPTAAHPLHGVGRAVLELVWFGAGALALYSARGPRAGLWFAGAWVLSTVLQAVTG
jgi:hypothetical protein